DGVQSYSMPPKNRLSMAWGDLPTTSTWVSKRGTPFFSSSASVSSTCRSISSLSRGRGDGDAEGEGEGVGLSSGGSGGGVGAWAAAAAEKTLARAKTTERETGLRAVVPTPMTTLSTQAASRVLKSVLSRRAAGATSCTCPMRVHQVAVPVRARLS